MKRPPKDFQPKPLRYLFEKNKQWENLTANDLTLRPIEIEEVTKMLACGHSVLGGKEYECSHDDCPHCKHLWFTCSSRCCLSCGKKATDNWIKKQLDRLPACPWLHITLTFPDVFWPLFKTHRWLLDYLCQLAVDNLRYAAKQRGLEIGIFCALHTNGRRLTWHPHVHLSVTLGGINAHGEWKNMSFKHKNVESRWRNQLCDLLLNVYDSLTVTNKESECRNFDEWHRLVEQQRNRFWHVHFAKKTNNPKATINYLGRYLKRPPISGARLQHYRGEASIKFRYLNHHTGKYETEEVSQKTLVKRIIQHIPEKGFRMIRYFGFLANRVVGKKLPLVRKALGMDENPAPSTPLRYGQLFKAFLNIDPYTCILCGSKMVLKKYIITNGRKEIVAAALDRRRDLLT